MSFVQDTWDDLRGKTGERAAQEAGALSVGAQREALDYLKETEAVPQGFRESAFQRLGGLYGLEGGVGDQLAPVQVPGMTEVTPIDQAAVMQEAMQSPLYSALMGSLGQSEDAILRNAAATGGLRSGNVQDALAENASNLQRQALLGSYQDVMGRRMGERDMQLGLQEAYKGRQLGVDASNQAQMLAGLSGLSGTQSIAPMVAQGITNIGATQGQALTAGAQSRMQGLGNVIKLGTQAYAASDIRLKKDIGYIGKENGVKWYRWTWNELAESLGLSGDSVGVMAHEQDPSLLAVHESGYLMVNYGEL